MTQHYGIKDGFIYLLETRKIKNTTEVGLFKKCMYAPDGNFIQKSMAAKVTEQGNIKIHQVRGLLPLQVYSVYDGVCPNFAR